MKNITRKQFILYNKIIDLFAASIPDKGDKFYAEDLDFFSRIEASTLDFETSFIIREDDGGWAVDDSNSIKMREYNDDGEPWITTKGTFENRFEIMEVNDEILGDNG